MHKCPNCQAEAQLAGDRLICPSCGTFQQNDKGEWVIAAKPADPPAEPKPAEPPPEPPKPQPVDERSSIEIRFWDGRNE